MPSSTAEELQWLSDCDIPGASDDVCELGDHVKRQVKYGTRLERKYSLVTWKEMQNILLFTEKRQLISALRGGGGGGGGNFWGV
jgi:hypothetical protein